MTSFQSELQLNITRLRRADAGEYNPADYSPCTEKNMDEMYQQILSYISQVNDRYLRQLLDVFYKNDSELVAKIRIHPAAKSVHHNFVGGYLEHVTSVAGIAEYLAGKYSPVNRDLVITAALLHDIGKLWELTPMPAGDYSMEGQLLG
ncbi:MAG: HDIG domain-containing protein, partial [Firmicutes bacterium]|nr:HDIG domain-containing protein [Bacillota bacterium]